MRVLITGGTGVLGRAFQPLAEASGYQVRAPGGPNSTCSTPTPSLSATAVSPKPPAGIRGVNADTARNETEEP
jgi:nucleoside-diphosphate-sugar epimerase